MPADDVRHHGTPEIVINKDPRRPPERQIMLVDDYGHRIELSVEQLRTLAETVVSAHFPAITAL